MTTPEITKSYARLDCGCTWFHHLHGGRFHCCPLHRSPGVESPFRRDIVRQLKAHFFKINPQWAGLRGVK